MASDVSASGFSYSVTQASNSGVPSVVSVSPNTGSGATQIFTAVYSDTGGANLLSDREIVIAGFIQK